MTLQKKIRLVLICVALVPVIFLAPLLLIVGSNLGAGILDIVLNRRPAVAELLGNYKFLAPWGIATLRISSDGTFEEGINENGKPTRKVSGTWKSHDGENFVGLDFKPFGMVWDDDHDRETNIYEIDFYRPHFGATYGLINDDLGEKFERQ